MDKQPYGVVEADARIYAAIRAITDLMTKGPQITAVDYADVRAVAEDCGGLTVAGHGVASGLYRASKAAEAAWADLQDQLVALRSGTPA